MPQNCCYILRVGMHIPYSYTIANDFVCVYIEMLKPYVTGISKRIILNQKEFACCWIQLCAYVVCVCLCLCLL
jgi:hypothetical protein